MFIVHFLLTAHPLYGTDCALSQRLHEIKLAYNPI